MSLRLRVLLLMLFAALAPLALYAAWSVAEVRRVAEEENAARLDAAQITAEQRVDERIDDQRRLVERLCERDFTVDRVLLDLAAGRFDGRVQGDLVAQLPNLARSLDLDVLELVELPAGEAAPDAGRVLAASHFAGRAGGSPGALAASARASDGRAFVEEVRVRQDGGARNARALLHACVAARDGAQVLVVGGRLLEERFVGALLGDVRPVRLVVAPPGAGPPPGVSSEAARREVYVFVDAAANPIARLLAVVDPGPLERQLDELQQGFLFYGVLPATGVAVVLGLLLGVWVTRPLGLLEAATREVARGNLDVTFAGVPRGEVGQVLGAFEAMTRDLKAAQAELRRVARVAAWQDIARHLAHEIKNPLSPIQISVETMRKTHARQHPDFDEIFDESTTAILEEVRRLSRIVSEFSSFARLPAPRPEAVSVSDLVSHVVALHQGGRARVESRVDPELPTVEADREQIVQALVNLVQNAVDAAASTHPAGDGTVEVVAEALPPAAGEGWMLRVIDDGPGIPEGLRDRVFEPYVTTKAGGSGLGLAIAARIIDDHGGRLSARDAPSGPGAELRAELPLVAGTPSLRPASTETVVPLVQRR